MSRLMVTLTTDASTNWPTFNHHLLQRSRARRSDAEQTAPHRGTLPNKILLENNMISFMPALSIDLISCLRCPATDRQDYQRAPAGVRRSLPAPAARGQAEVMASVMAAVEAWRRPTCSSFGSFALIRLDWIKLFFTCKLRN